MDILFQGFMLGLVSGIIPGTVTTVLLVSTLQGGFLSGMRTLAWVFCAEIVVVGTFLLVILQLPVNQEVFALLGGIGGCVLLYFAWRVYQLQSITLTNEHILFTAPKIFLLHATNAPLYIFWTTIGLSFIVRLSQTWPTSIAAISFVAIFETGWLLAKVVTLLLFVFSRSTLVNTRVMRIVFVITSGIFAIFGVRLLVPAITALIH